MYNNQDFMKKFERLLKGHKSLVFLDFEGTQFSHEMIAIGAVHAVIDRHGYIKKSKSNGQTIAKKTIVNIKLEGGCC